MLIKSKFLSDAGWKDLAAKNKLKDNGLAKTLERLKRTDDEAYDEQARALEEVVKLVAALKKDKAVTAASAVVKYVGEMQGDAEVALRDVSKARAEHEKAVKAKAEAEKAAAKKAEQEDEEDEDDESPELLTTRLKPLLKLVAKGQTMHALLAKSGKQVVVMLSRKPIPPARRKILADQLGGGSAKYYPGTCGLEAGATTFALRAEVAGMAKLVKQAVLEQTGVRLTKLKCRGDDGDDQDHDDDLAADAAQPNAGSASVADFDAGTGAPAAPLAWAPGDGGNSAAPTNARARGAQGPRERTEGQGEFIGSKGILIFDFAPGVASLTPNQERALLTQQIKFSSRGARLRITGHSSSEEDAAVSQKRADAVAAFLRADPKHPVPNDNILEAKGVGASRPVATEGTKDKADEVNRKRNRSVEVVLTTAGEFLGGADVDVDAGNVGKGAPHASERAGDAVGYTDIVAALVAGVFEGTALGFAAEFVGPVAMLAHVALAWEEARASQQRIAYADGARNGADAARDFIARGHARVAYRDVESAAMPKIDDMTYFPAESWEAKQAASSGVGGAVESFEPAMRRTEAFVRKRLEAKGLKDRELQEVYDKIIGDMRYKIASALADALKAKAQEIRRG